MKMISVSRPWSARWVASFAVVLGLCAMSAPAWALGLLLPQEPQLPPLAVKTHHVRIDVTDQASVTKVEQVFVNHTDRQLEATFYFPVPPGATVSDFALWINGKKTPGAVLDKDQARQTYEGIVRRTQDPGLVEYMDGTLFQARIFPVPARGEQRVEISFAQVLDQDGDVRRLVYPLKTGKQAARLLQDFSVEVHISSKAPLKAIYSPTHKVQARRDDDHHAIVGVEESGADLEKDFLLYMATGGDDVGLTLLTYDEDGKGGEEGYFMLVLAPKIALNEDEVPARAITFVVDTSGSMSGEKIEQAKAALIQCLGKLRPKDRFNVVRFSTDVEPLFSNPAPATPENVQRGLSFARGMEAAGGTAIDDALKTALSQKVEGDLSHLVMFMTDGRPTVGTTDVNQILEGVKGANASKARVFTFGVGFDLNTTLLDTLARDHRGTSDYVRPQEDIEVKVSAIYNKIAYPVMSDVKLDYGQAQVYDVYPRQMPDLFRGGQILLMGRSRDGAPERFKLSGALAGRNVQLDLSEKDPIQGSKDKPNDFIPKLWATRKVGYLLEEIRAHGEDPELKQEVIRLAKKYGLVTPYTSYLAVDDSELTPPPVVRPEPRPVPWGPPVDPWLEGDARGAAPAAEDRFFHGGGGGGAVGGKAGNAQPAAPSKVLERRKQEEALGESESFKKDTGERAVETSIALDDLKAADVDGDAGGIRTRYVGNRLFVFQQGAWTQDGVTGAASVKVKAFSPAWFRLLEAHPELKPCLGLTGRVILKVGSKVVEVGAEGQEDLTLDQIKRW